MEAEEPVKGGNEETSHQEQQQQQPPNNNPNSLHPIWNTPFPIDLNRLPHENPGYEDSDYAVPVRMEELAYEILMIREELRHLERKLGLMNHPTADVVLDGQFSLVKAMRKSPLKAPPSSAGFMLYK
ncbi:CRM family member 3B [Corchorus olitorius]|uniref:CRM family member 3B n=1 Tax=Corchorus olitorius TaxID=93759 RepID=A0A1R3JHB1_9ROSI|nr:CRM family member 3B [Corchorus olitorius]